MLTFRKTLGIALLLLVLFSCSSAQREIPSSQLQERGDGLCYAVNEDVPYTGTVINKDIMSGQKTSVKTYKDGLLHGLTTRWRSDGQKKSEENYENGKKSGMSRSWDESGKLSSEVMFKNDLQDGHYIDYYSSGQKRIEADHVAGKREGHSVFWYSDGQVRWDKWYKGGELDGDFAEWYENGSQQSLGAYTMGRKTGKWTTWYEDGQMKSEENYDQGLRNGRCTLWYENGHTKEIANYANDRIVSDLQLWKENGDAIGIGEVTDVDGNKYLTVQIGEQWWMMENLKVTRYRNLDSIPNISGEKEWGKFSGHVGSKFYGRGAYCEYDNDPSNVDTYGRLYNSDAVTDQRNIAPEGWHVPTEPDWMELRAYLESNQGGKLKESGTQHWRSPNEGATNESGFNALPAGKREYRGAYNYSNKPSFLEIGQSAYFWYTTEYPPNMIFIENGKKVSGANKRDTDIIILNSASGDIDVYTGGDNGCAYSVRCVKD